VDSQIFPKPIDIDPLPTTAEEPPPKEVDPRLSRSALTALSEQLIAAAPPLDPLIAAVRAVVVGSLTTTGDPIDAAAEAVGMTRRTFQRQLARRGTSYDALRDELRKQLATALLADGPLSTTALANALGYGHVTAFHRAFRRWTGTTPQTFATVVRRLQLPPTPYSLRAVV
jgi:AraC-like DNA-binding protein